jgi:hemolysin D
MKSFRFAPARQSEPEPDKVVRLFQSETAEVLYKPAPLKARMTILVLAAMFASLIAVTLVMTVDRVVSTSSGQIVASEGTSVVQALDTSIIKTINVHEGQQVKKGELLATLDPTFAAADVGALKTQIASLDAQIARCEAELAGKPFVATTDPSAAGTMYVALQKSYYQQRKAQFDAQTRSYDEQIGQIKAAIARVENDQARYGDRAKLAKEVEQMRATLAANQVGSRLNLLAATDQKTELLRNLEADRNSLVESRHQLEATVSTKNAFVQQWLGQTSQELVTARNQRDTAVQQLEKALRHQELVHLYAPEDAVVLKMAKLSVGSVLKDGDPFLHPSPLHSPMEAEVHIAPRDIGFIRVGDPATLKLDPFNFVEHGKADGTVSWISEGAFTSDDNGTVSPEPYYKVRIALTNVKLHNVPDTFRLIPGMTLTGDIRIGTRSLFMYILAGTLQGAGEAMREP